MQCTDSGNYTKDGDYISSYPPCNKCLSCLLNRQHQWASRLCLEAMGHSVAQFITCTFDEEHLPPANAKPEHYKHIWQKFIKRFRKASGRQPRYYACLEYGNRFQRPHFHAIFFGRATTLERRKAERSSAKHTVIRVDPMVEDCWGLGSTYVKACDSSTMMMSITQYVAGYILKGKWSNIAQSKGEFAMMSRIPYLGHPGVKILSDTYTTAKGARRIAKLGTIPNYFYYNKRRYQMPSRIRWDIGEYLGYPVLPLRNGQKPQTKAEANAKSNKIARSIRTRRKINTSLQTG